MRRHIYQGFARAALLGDEADLASFLTFGFAELEFQVRTPLVPDGALLTGTPPSSGAVDPIDRFPASSYAVILYQRKSRKLSYGRGQGPTLLPAGCVCGGGGPALEAAWFAVPVRWVSLFGPPIT